MSQAKECASSPREDPMPSTSDFVKKLYKMLEDPNFQSVVCWGPHGDCFVVKDMNEFTKSILPRMFKHSNFASFVRQLNKYDFHKVKNTDDNQYGEHSWTFRHPDFHIDRRDALENIKRKVPAQRKAQQAAAVAAQAQAVALQSLPNFSSSALLPNPTVTVQAQNQLQVEQLQHEIRRLKEEGDDLRGRVRILERNYENVLVEMVGFQRGMAQQDGLMQSLISYFLGNETDKQKILSMLSGSQSPLSTLHRDSPLSLPQWQNQSQLQTPRELGSTSAQTQAQYNKASLVASSLSSLPPLPQSRSHPQSSSDGTFDSSNPYMSGNNGSSEVGVTNTLSNGSDTRYATPSMDHDADTRMAWSGDPSSSAQIPQVSPSVTGLTSASGFSSSDGQRTEALSKIEEFYRARTKNNDTSADRAQPWDDRKRDLASSSAPQHWNALNAGVDGDQTVNRPLASSLSVSDEGIQVYTLGKLVPRKDQVNWNTTVDPSAVSGSGTDSFTRNSTSTSRYDPSPSSQNSGRSLGGSRSDQKRRRDEGEDDDSEEEEECVMPTPTIPPINPPPSISDKSSPVTLVPSSSKGPSSSADGQKIRVRRTAFVPSWAVPPRVLIVDDDIISRKLGGKFLQVSGCQFDMAVDGESAVNKMMNLEKYDLVLMDIMMPKLDGLAATSMIRQFDHRTPIISMTSNSKPSEIMAYYSSGMNDILTKPFTQLKLLEILDKHLTHLTMRAMKDVPRSIGVPPMSDPQFDQALKRSADSCKTTHSQPQSQLQNGTRNQNPNQDSSMAGSSGSSSLYSPTALASSSYLSTLAPSLGSFMYGQEQQMAILNMDDENRINNPFSGMGIPDEQYTVMLQNVMNGNNFMNGIDGAPTSSSSASPASVPSSSMSSPSLLSQQMMGSINGMMNTGLGISMLGTSIRGEKRAYESYDDIGHSRPNGREKRSRFEVIE